MKEMGLPVPEANSEPTILIRNEKRLAPAA